MSIIDTAKDVYDLAKTGATLELQERIIRLREEALNLQEENLALRQEMADLKQKITLDSNMEFDGKKYWKTIGEDKKDGPFCQKCFDTDSKTVRLQDHSSHGDRGGYFEHWFCAACKIGY